MANSVKLNIISGIIFVILILGGLTLTWRFDKEYTTLYLGNSMIARSRWFVEAERTYIRKDSWYDENIKCPRILDDGGYETETRCYYPDQYYEQMARSLINTDISYVNNSGSYDVIKDTPFYQYGTRGSYAGIFNEVMRFNKHTQDIEEFPYSYDISWAPRDTRNYRLQWRIENLKNIELKDGNYTDCFYSFGRVKIDLADMCSELDHAQVKDGTKIWFYFKQYRGTQQYSPRLYDPEIVAYKEEDVVDKKRIYQDGKYICAEWIFINPTKETLYEKETSIDPGEKYIKTECVEWINTLDPITVEMNTNIFGLRDVGTIKQEFKTFRFYTNDTELIVK